MSNHCIECFERKPCSCDEREQRERLRECPACGDVICQCSDDLVADALSKPRT